MADATACWTAKPQTANLQRKPHHLRMSVSKNLLTWCAELTNYTKKDNKKKRKQRPIDRAYVASTLTQSPHTRRRRMYVLFLAFTREPRDSKRIAQLQPLKVERHGHSTRMSAAVNLSTHTETRWNIADQSGVPAHPPALQNEQRTT